MAILKVIELMSHSEKSWEDAAKQAVAEAAKTIHNIRSVYIKEQSATVTGNNITDFRVNVKLTFEVDNTDHAKHSTKNK